MARRPNARARGARCLPLPPGRQSRGRAASQKGAVYQTPTNSGSCATRSTRRGAEASERDSVRRRRLGDSGGRLARSLPPRRSKWRVLRDLGA
jgi:hypothetical protein